MSDHRNDHPTPTGAPARGWPVPGGFPPRDHPQSTTALVLGIAGLAGTFICGVPVVLGPFAWYVGAKARREIDARPDVYAGRGQAVTGMVLGIVSTVLLVLGVIAVIAFVALVLGFGTSNNG